MPIWGPNSKKTSIWRIVKINICEHLLMDENWTLMDEMHPSSCNLLMRDGFHSWMMSECEWHIVCLCWMIEILKYVLSLTLGIGSNMTFMTYAKNLWSSKILKNQMSQLDNEPLGEIMINWTQNDMLQCKIWDILWNLGNFACWQIPIPRFIWWW
jgi:hypothetical protein